MTRHISPYNQTSVPVLDRDGRPISPTRPSRARRWTESGRAVKVWKNGQFSVQLADTEADKCITPEMSVNVDPGDRTTGMAVMLNGADSRAKVVKACEVKHRGHTISQRMKTRSSHRRNRRGRLRRRPARFNNRTRKADWLPPSMESRLANITTTVRHLTGLFPVTELKLETCKFDPRLMQNPEVTGAGYQTSERGRIQVREYVLQRDGRTCQYRQKCRGGRNRRLELDHVVPESRGGPCRISNLVTACRTCNQAKGNRPIEEFLARKPERLGKVRAQLKKPLASATHMNQLMPLLIRALEAFGLPLLQTDAVTTAHTRRVLEIEKTHANDAACLGKPKRVMNIPKTVQTVESTGHGNRRMLTYLSKHGTPRCRRDRRAGTTPTGPTAGSARASRDTRPCPGTGAGREGPTG